MEGEGEREGGGGGGGERERERERKRQRESDMERGISSYITLQNTPSYVSSVKLRRF